MLTFLIHAFKWFTLLEVIGGYAKSVVKACFNGCSALQFVELSSSIESIADNAFTSCSGLKGIVCKASTPPTLATSSGLGSSPRIYVRGEKEILKLYNESWGTISRIYPIAEVMLLTSQTFSSYKTEIDKIDKSKVTSISLCGGYSTDFTEEILKTGINPNCVFILPYSNIVGDNIINYTTDKSIELNKLVLDEKYPFSSLIECDVKEVELRHNPLGWADGTNGWETIVLPFSPSFIEASESGYINPIRQSSSGNFWLRQYVGSSDEAVYFASTSDGVMKANTPYLVAFPGDKMGKGSLEGQTITFKAKNVTIPVTTIPSIQKNGYTFVGNYDTTADEGGGWTLNSEGNAFVWSETVGDKPFSAYFKGEAPAAGASALRMSFGQMDNATGLEQNMADLIDHADETVYTLDGRKVNTKDLKPGLYIKNHKKMMVR